MAMREQKSYLGLLIVDPENGLHGVAGRDMRKLQKNGKSVRMVGLCSPQHCEGTVPLRWYRASRLQVVGPYAVVYPKLSLRPTVASLFGGSRAVGGVVPPGKSYLVGESGCQGFTSALKAEHPFDELPGRFGSVE